MQLNSIEFTTLIFAGSVLGGFLSAMTGLGGGVVVIPLLTVIFRVDIHYAMGAALVSVIATSSGASAAYVREGYSNIRVGMFLEMATTAGALAGAALALYLHAPAIAIIFGLVLICSALVSFHEGSPLKPGQGPDPIATWLHMDSTYPTNSGLVSYHVRGVPMGFLLMVVAGVLSGLLGIGSGALKVLAMDKAMKLPFKVSTTTSNFMIGVTAAAGSGIYSSRGYIDPGLTMPVMLGVLVGSLTGARVLAGTKVGVLRIVFAAVIGAIAIEMIYSGLTGKI
jgi:uncharacterized membrane protein YfcA